MSDISTNQDSSIDQQEVYSNSYETEDEENVVTDEYESEGLSSQTSADKQWAAAELAAVAAYVQHKIGDIENDSRYENLTIEELYAILIIDREYKRQRIRELKELYEVYKKGESGVDLQMSDIDIWIRQANAGLRGLDLANQTVVQNIELVISLRIQECIQQEYEAYQAEQERLLDVSAEIGMEIEEGRKKIAETQKEFKELDQEFKAKQEEIIDICKQIVVLRTKTIADLELMLESIARQELSIEAAEQKIEEVAQDLVIKYQQIEQEYQAQIKQIIANYEAEMTALANKARRRSRRRGFVKGLFAIAAGALAAVTAGALAPALFPALLSNTLALGLITSASFGATSAAVMRGNVLKGAVTGIKGAIVGNGVISMIVNGGKLRDHVLNSLGSSLAQRVIPQGMNTGNGGREILDNMGRAAISTVIPALVQKEDLGRSLAESALKTLAQDCGSLAGEKLVTAVTTIGTDNKVEDQEEVDSEKNARSKPGKTVVKANDLHGKGQGANRYGVLTNETLLFNEHVRRNQGGNGGRRFMRLAADGQVARNINDVSIETEDVLRFGGGVVQGKITGDLFVAATKAPGVIGKLARGAGVVGAVAMAAEIEQGAYRFRTEHFSQSDLYDDLWSNRLISAEQRAAICEPALQRELAARATAGPAKSITQVFKERAGSLGFSAGLLLAPVTPKTTEVLRFSAGVAGEAILSGASSMRSIRAQQGFVDLEIFGGKQTKGIAEKQLTEVGRYKPEPLLPSEEARVLEFKQARNQYLKWCREVDVSGLPIKSKFLLDNQTEMNMIRDKATPDTLAALYKESRGVEIRDQLGEIRDHTRKAREANQSMVNLLEGLKGRLQTLEATGQAGTAEANLVQEKLSRLSKLKDLYTPILQETEALKCQGGIPRVKP